MNYYDGNTVTALWNYAQQFAMSDNSYGTTFGPSAPGAINLVSGDTGGVDMTQQLRSSTSAAPTADARRPDGTGGYSLTSDAQPYCDDCSTRDAVAMTGTNIGDELNAAGLSLGLVPGRLPADDTFATRHGDRRHPADHRRSSPTSSKATSTARSRARTPPTRASATRSPGRRRRRRSAGTGQYGYKDDYIPHHEPFQYYASTANPHHLTIPTDAAAGHARRAAEIGTDTQTYVDGEPQFNTPNHQYDIERLRPAGRGDRQAAQLPPSALPAVSFLKAPGYEDGHAGYSDPLDEQKFIVDEINALRADPGLVEHRGDRHLRRLRRLVRPRLQRRHQPVASSVADAARPAPASAAAQTVTPAGRRAGPLRLRPAPAAARHLAVGQGRTTSTTP